MTTYIAKGHGGDGGDRPPHGDPKRLLKGCESCKLVVHEYFDLDSLRNTDQWEGIRLGIHVECQRAYKDRKQEFKKHLILLEVTKLLRRQEQNPRRIGPAGMGTTH
ncbi:hypothetical protein R6Q57_023980 [Mikania cordata]